MALFRVTGVLLGEQPTDDEAITRVVRAGNERDAVAIVNNEALNMGKLLISAQAVLVPRVEAEAQELLRNAQYLGDGYVLVLTQDVEALQDALREMGVQPPEPQPYAE